MKINHELGTTNYTYITCEDKEVQKFNAPHKFEVRNVNTDEVISSINFQEGPIKECGVNGIANEDAIIMVLTRLKSFQESPYACEENAIAISHLEDSLKVLRERTLKRIVRNVEGTSEV